MLDYCITDIYIVQGIRQCRICGLFLKSSETFVVVCSSWAHPEAASASESFPVILGAR